MSGEQQSPADAGPVPEPADVMRASECWTSRS